MLNRWRLSAYILLALVAGIGLASFATKVTYPCPLHPGEAGCISYGKAVMHPIDLVSNMQDSLTRFLLYLLVGFVVVLVLLIAFNAVWVWIKKRDLASREQ